MKNSCTLWIASFAFLAAPAYAVDGIILINQNAALAGNVTPGDAPGFPVTISVSGSYRLSSNLTVSDPNTDAIDIQVTGVTIDLNGFAIIGPTTCTLGSTVTCSPVGTGSGIVSSRSISTVLNGQILGMASNGVFLLDGRVEKVVAFKNAGTGIRTLGTVESCIARQNLSDGIDGQAVLNSTAFENGATGISATLMAVNSIARHNIGRGIDGGVGATITGNTAIDNGNIGISAACPSTIVSNTAANNTGGDIFTSGSGCTRANNTPAP